MNAREKGTLSLDLRQRQEITNCPTSRNSNAAKWLKVKSVERGGGGAGVRWYVGERRGVRVWC